jgi:hypothetical protein
LNKIFRKVEIAGRMGQMKETRNIALGAAEARRRNDICAWRDARNGIRKKFVFSLITL